MQHLERDNLQIYFLFYVVTRIYETERYCYLMSFVYFLYLNRSA